jgi:hypothetical protein
MRPFGSELKMKQLAAGALVLMIAICLAQVLYASNPDYHGQAPPPDCAVVYTLNPERNDIHVVGKRETTQGAFEYAIEIGTDGLIAAVVSRLDTGLWVLKWTIPGEASAAPYEKIIVYRWPFSWNDYVASKYWAHLNAPQRGRACHLFYDKYVSQCGVTWESFQRSHQGC